MEALENIEQLKTAFDYSTEVPLMGFKGHYDVFLQLITDIMKHIGVGHDHEAYVAFLKLQELKQELLTLHDIRKVSTVSLTKPTEEGTSFFATIEHIDKHLTALIENIAHEKVTLTMHYSNETFAEIEQLLKHCANQLNRIKCLLQEQI